MLVPPFSKKREAACCGCFPWIARSLPTAALPASGSKVEGGSFLSACQHKLPRIWNQKTEYPLIWIPRNTHYGSYVGIIRIRFMGRRWFLPLSLSAQAPRFRLYWYHTTVCSGMQAGTSGCESMLSIPAGGFPLSKSFWGNCTMKPAALSSMILPCANEQPSPMRDGSRCVRGNRQGFPARSIKQFEQLAAISRRSGTRHSGWR